MGLTNYNSFILGDRPGVVALGTCHCVSWSVSPLGLVYSPGNSPIASAQGAQTWLPGPWGVSGGSGRTSLTVHR